MIYTIYTITVTVGRSKMTQGILIEEKIFKEMEIAQNYPHPNYQQSYYLPERKFLLTLIFEFLLI